MRGAQIAFQRKFFSSFLRTGRPEMISKLSSSWDRLAEDFCRVL